MSMRSQKRIKTKLRNPSFYSKMGLLVLSSSLTFSVNAGNSWLSRSVVKEQPQQQKQKIKYAYSTSSAVTKRSAASVDSSLTTFDITVSLHNSPAGDDDASTTGNDEQTKYEEILGHFADAICEQSNGAHKLAKVSLFKNSNHQSKADIVWNDKEWPRAHPSGFGANGMHIFFGDVFPGGSGGADYDMLANPIAAGYTLGHEWGHYTYGVFDEYKGNDPLTKSDRSPQNTDIGPTPSIMHSQWRAVNGDAKWLNHSTSNNIGDTARTAQGRVYGKSAWDVLVQDTKDDPKSGAKTAQPSRTRYTALSSVAPDATDSWVKEELPAGQTDCRDELNIVWVAGNLDIDILIDRSGSMRGNAIINARQAAKLLVDATSEGDAALGVDSFSSSHRVDSAFQAIPTSGSTVKTSIKNIIDNINASGGTALYDGALGGLNSLQSYQTANNSNSPGVVFILADGDDNSSSSNLSSTVAAYQAANIPIFSFGYGSASPTGPLLSLANSTGGRYFSSPTTLAEITNSFLQANAVASNSQNLLASSFALPTTGSSISTFIDDGIKDSNLFISWAGSINNITITALDPSSTPRPEVVFDCTALSTGVSCTAKLDEALLDLHGRGEWTIQYVNNLASDIDVDMNVIGEPSDSGAFTVSVDGTTGSEVTYPAPFIVTAAITKGNMVTGVNIVGTLTAPNNTETHFDLYDDGTNGDAIASDGIYSAILPYQTNGTYQVAVDVDNSNNTAAFTSTGILTPTEDGTQPAIPVLPAINENFFRVVKASLVVSGVPFSDGDDSTGFATGITADNSPIDSVINTAGDIDYYLLNGIDLASDLVVRVTDMSLGMLPKVTVYENDGSTEVITDALLAANISQTGYFYIVIPAAQLQSGMYISIEHEDTAVAQGGYQLSAGQALTTDVPPNISPTANDDSESLRAGAQVQIDLLANDSDADGDALTLTSVDSSATTGTVTIGTGGVVTYDTGTAYNTLGAGITVNDTFTYIVSDGNGGFTQANVTVSVLGNTPPTTVDDSATVQAGDMIQINVLTNDSDADGDTLTIDSVDTSATTGTVTIDTGGLITFDTSTAFDNLASGTTVIDTYTYTVSDGFGGMTTATVSITVKANTSPVATADTATVSEDATVTISVLTNDTDAEMHTLTVSSTDSSGLKGTLTGNDTLTYDPNGQFDSLNSGETATETFTYIVSDERGATSTGTVTVTITGVDDKKSSSGGGSFGWWTLAILLVGLRRLRN